MLSRQCRATLQNKIAAVRAAPSHPQFERNTIVTFYKQIFEA